MAKRNSNGLKFFREKAGLSQQELADKAGKTKWTIQNIEHRGFKPTLGTLEAIAKALGIPVGYLVYNRE